MTAYEVLGVPENASVDQIDFFWKHLMQRNHPDKGGDAEIAKQLNAAHDILKDTQKRAVYDAALRATRAPVMPPRSGVYDAPFAGGFDMPVYSGRGGPIIYTVRVRYGPGETTLVSARSTHTYVILEISAAAYAEISEKLKESGYSHAFHSQDDVETIDMHGIAIQSEKAPAAPDIPPEERCKENWVAGKGESNHLWPLQLKNGPNVYCLKCHESLANYNQRLVNWIKNHFGKTDLILVEERRVATSGEVNNNP